MCAPARLRQQGEGHVQHARRGEGEGELPFGAGVGAGLAGDRMHDAGLVSEEEPWTVICPPGTCRSTVARLTESWELTEVSVPAKIPTRVVPAALSRMPRKISSSPNLP